MERTITYRGRIFTIRADETNSGGYTEAVSEQMTDGTVAHWDGSGIEYDSADECLDETERMVRETVDEDAADDSGS